MRKTTMDIYKAMFPSLLIYLLLVAFFTQIFKVMGLGMENLVTMGSNPAMPMAAPQFQFTAMSGVTLVVYGIFYIVSGLVGYGIVLMIYRAARYDTDVSFVDAFYFFNRKAASATGTYIIEKILMGILFLLLVVPGILFSLAMVPLGAVMGIEQIRGRSGALAPIKDSWQMTKGHKGMIFGRMVIVIIVIAVISGGVGVLSMTAGLSKTAMLVMQNLLTVVIGLITYVAEVDIIRELVERGAFDAIDRPDDEEEDFSIEGGAM